MTIAIFIKLILIKSVASKDFGVFISCNILLSLFVPEILNSSISPGANEKKADSAAEMSAAQTRSNNMENIETAILTVKDLIIIPKTGRQ